MMLSILIPARNEMFLARTVQDLLQNIRGETEIIVVLDGQWADPGLQQDPRLTVVYLPESIGQRAATNLAAKLSRAKYVMKIDAHCSVDEGFDQKMIDAMEELGDNVTLIPRMYNLHAFDWICPDGHRRYQSPSGPCDECGKDTTREIIWQAKKSPETDFMRFDSDLRFQYWSGRKKDPAAAGDLAETMSLLGACFMLSRESYWKLDICDVAHGSWGQQGTEVACKTWLSGGRLMVNKRTWFAHMFRTQGGDFGFPYPNLGVEKAREYSRRLWLEGQWPLAVRSLEWLLNKFQPPGWNTKGIVFYTDNQIPIKMAKKVQDRLRRVGLPIVSSSIKPMPHFGTNVHVPGERGALQMFRQILAALEASSADIVFFCEADVLYHPSHFEFRPPRKDVWYYNTNVWKLDTGAGKAWRTDDCRQVSGICVYRQLAIAHYRERIRRVELEGFSNKMGYEPGTHGRPERVDDATSDRWESQYPNVDIRHDHNLSHTKRSPEEFRNQKYAAGWTESEEIPGWGPIGKILA